jgi:transcriptional regulator with XRE-family HTH domain
MNDWYADGTATLGDRITAAREAAGLGAGDLARRLGVERRTVIAWEDDQAEPRANRMQMLAGVLGVSLRWLMSGSGPGVGEPAEVPPDAAVHLSAMRSELRGLRELIREAEARASRLDRRIAHAFGEPG